MASKKLIDEVWEKGTPMRGRNTETWRRDPEGNVIRKGSYGTRGNTDGRLIIRFPWPKAAAITSEIFSRFTTKKIARNPTESGSDSPAFFEDTRLLDRRAERYAHLCAGQIRSEVISISCQ